jgi:predicted nicotinamide N-methyase
VIAADVVYNAVLGAALTRLVRACRARGLVVVVADSGRPFFEQGTLVPVDAALIEVPPAVEGAAFRRVTLYRGDSPTAPPRPEAR